jgi:hypothetical protein
MGTFQFYQQSKSHFVGGDNMQKHRHSIDERYAALFVSGSQDSHQQLSRLAQDAPISLYAYQSPVGVICIAIAGQHPEPLTNWLRKIQEAVPGSSFFISIVSPKLRLPPTSEAWLFQSKIVQVEEDSLVYENVRGAYFCFLDVFRNDFYLLSPSFVGFDVLRLFPMLGEPRRELVPIIAKQVPQVVHRSQRVYDPIEANAREVLSSSVESLKQILGELKKTWSSKVAIDIPFEILRAEEELDHASEYLRATFAKEFKTSTLSNSFMYSLDRLASWIATVSAESARLIEQLNAQEDIKDPWTSRVTYKPIIDKLVLNATRIYCTDLVSRGNLPISIDFVPTYSEGFSILNGLLSQLGLQTINESEEKWRHDKPKRSMLLSIPYWLRHRLGALPVFGHSIGHLFASENMELEKTFAEMLYGIVFNKRLINEWETFHRACSEILVKLKMEDSDENNMVQQIQKEHIIAKMTFWTRDLLADLIATLLQGPAYVYSLRVRPQTRYLDLLETYR